MAKKRMARQPRESLCRAESRRPRCGRERLLNDLRGLIEQARQQVVRTVNSAMVGLYWSIGNRIREDILHEQRAEYGEQIVPTLSAQLTAEYGRGFGRQNLFRMIRFAEVFPDEQIVQSLMDNCAGAIS